MNMLIGLLFSAVSAASGEIKKDSLVLFECDPHFEGRYTYGFEYFRKGKGGVTGGGGGGDIPVVKHCIRLSVGWKVPMDSIGLEVWDFAFNRKGGLLPKKKYVWKFAEKVVISDSLFEFPLDDGGDDCADQKKKAASP